MSHSATKWAFDQPEIHHDMKPNEWAVLMVLADCHNPVNGCFPSQDYICRKTNLAERSVREQLTRLRDRLLIRWDEARENGRRGANRYRLAFELDFQPANPAGSSTGEIPPDQPADSDTDNRQDLPPNLVREPVREPLERARASEPEDPKKVEAEGWALLKDWPGFAGMPKEPAMKVWRQLTADERSEASRKFAAWLALLKAQHKSHIPAPSTYLGQKLFREVPEPADDKPLSIEARPFGKLWQAVRLKLLLAEPTGMIPELTWIERQMVETGKADEAELRRDKRSRHGWPTVNQLHDAASYGKSVHASPGHEPLSAMMVQVRVNSEEFEAWKLEHQLRGWPWLPDPGRQEWVYFPAGGPQEGLRQFEQAVRGNNVDGRAQAAE